MDFAKAQLTKQGWTDGSGLGKDESGIKEPVKVKIKNDNRGVGHDSGAEFTFHWWDHLFNKAASNIDVKHTEAGVEIKNATITERSKNKTKTYDSKAMMYGQFVKGATLSGGTETVEQRKVGEEVEEAPIKHALIPDNEEEVFKRCGGRTAHKGARHGLQLNGKLQRIEQQEQLLLDKLSGKSTNQGQGQSSGQDMSQSEQASIESHDSGVGRTGRVKKKRKLNKQNYQGETGDVEEHSIGEFQDVGVDAVELNGEDVKSEKKKKKKKRRDKVVVDDVDMVSEVIVAVIEHTTSDIDDDDVKSEKKKKKKKRMDKVVDEEVNGISEVTDAVIEDDTSDIKIQKKKKKKKKKHEEDVDN